MSDVNLPGRLYRFADRLDSLERGEVHAIRIEASAVRDVRDAADELRCIDDVMARRPALDKPSRMANVEHAINTASRADKFARENTELRARLALLTARLEPPADVEAVARLLEAGETLTGTEGAAKLRAWYSRV